MHKSSDPFGIPCSAALTYGVPLSRDEDVFPGISKVLQRLHMVLLILGSLGQNI